VVCEAWEVVIVPFPFTDSPQAKRRPALVLSPAAFNGDSGHTILAMITAAGRSRWPGDVPLDEETRARLGLTKPCLIRMKWFTIDNRLILRSAGRIPAERYYALRLFLEQLLPG